jgi:hypothetical protein
MGEVIHKYDFDKEIKKRERAIKREERRRRFEEWFNNNRELALILIPAGITLTGFVVKGTINITKGAIRSYNLKKEEQIKNLYCYDRSLGHYWALKRELTNVEWLEIEKRKKNGERLADILSDLRVLK